MIYQLKNIQFISVTKSKLGESEKRLYLEVYTGDYTTPKVIPLKSEAWTTTSATFHTEDDMYIIEFDNIKNTKSLITMPRFNLTLQDIEETFGITKNNIV